MMHTVASLNVAQHVKWQWGKFRRARRIKEIYSGLKIHREHQPKYVFIGKGRDYYRNLCPGKRTKSIFVPGFYLPITGGSPSEYYVATNGDNGNPGTLAEPWRMIQYGCDQLLAGDILTIRGGTYNEAVRLNANGIGESVITIQNYLGETPILDGGGIVPDGGYLFSLRGEHGVVDGIDVINANYGGIEGWGIYSIIRNCIARTCGSHGLLVWGDNSIIDTCISHGNGGAGAVITGMHPWLSVATEGHNCTIKNTKAWNNGHEGVTSWQAFNSTLEDNISYDNLSVNLYVNNVATALVQRNLVYETGDPNYHQVGIGLCDERYDWPPKLSDLTIINNLVMGTRRNLYYWVQHLDSGLKNTLIAHNTFVNSRAIANIWVWSGKHLNTQFINNIFLQEDEIPIADVPDDPEITWSHNLWSKAPMVNAIGIGDVIADPLLSKDSIIAPGQLTGDWFNLRSDSPARDAGIDLGIELDYRGLARPMGSAPDMGAYEYVEGIMSVITDLQAIEVALRQQVLDLIVQADAVAQAIVDLQAVDDVLDVAADVIVDD